MYSTVSTLIFLSLSMCILFGTHGAPSPASHRLSESSADVSRPRSLLPVVHRPTNLIRSRMPVAEELLQWDDEDSLQEIMKRQSSDDYGHMRFGKRAEFDDYGHMRFGRGGF